MPAIAEDGEIKLSSPPVVAAVVVKQPCTNITNKLLAMYRARKAEGRPTDHTRRSHLRDENLGDRLVAKPGETDGIHELAEDQYTVGFQEGTSGIDQVQDLSEGSNTCTRCPCIGPMSEIHTQADLACFVFAIACNL